MLITARSSKERNQHRASHRGAFHLFVSAAVLLSATLVGCGGQDDVSEGSVDVCAREQSLAMSELEIEIAECNENETCAANARTRCETELSDAGCDGSSCQGSLLGSGGCPVETGAQVIDELLTDLTPVLNEAWPTAATALHLDPLQPVWSGSYDFSCRDGGDEYCAQFLAACDRLWVDINVSSVTGLSKLQFTDLHVLDVNDQKFDVTTGGRGAPAGPVVDGIFAPEGSAWNDANYAVVLKGTDFPNGVIIDLGTVQNLASAVLQADGNDSYIVEASVDGKVWGIWLTFGPATGTGLRTRQSPTVETSARYLNIYAYQGDGTYSVAELVPHLAGGGDVSPSSMQAYFQSSRYPLLTDGIFAPEGTAWNDPNYAYKINYGLQNGFVIDLGTIQPMRKLVVQADGAASFLIYMNPTSVGTTPIGYTQIASIPSKGNGLRTTTIDLLPPIDARSIAIASTTPSVVTSVSELQVFATDGNATPGCPYAGGAVEDYSCSYSGTATGHAMTISGSPISATISTAKLKAKCDDYFTSWTATLVEADPIHCTAHEPNGKATANVCGGVCVNPLPLQSLSYVAMDDLELSVGDLSCDVGGIPSWITDAVVPLVKDSVIGVITPVIEDALNDVINDYIPFPGTCQEAGN